MWFLTLSFFAFRVIPTTNALPCRFQELVSDSCPVDDLKSKIFRGRGWHRGWKFKMPPTPRHKCDIMPHCVHAGHNGNVMLIAQAWR
eukprot:s858_g24.t1